MRFLCKTSKERGGEFNQMNEIEIELKLQIRVGSYLTALKEGGSVSGENYAEEITSMTRTLSDKATSAASNVVQALVTLESEHAFKIVRL